MIKTPVIIIYLHVTFEAVSAIIGECINHFMQADFFIILPHNKFSCNNKLTVKK